MWSIPSRVIDIVLIPLAAGVFSAALLIGLQHPWGRATSDQIGLALLVIAFLCIFPCRRA